MKKKKETTLKELVGSVNCIGKEVEEIDGTLEIKDSSNFLMTAHPFIKKRIIFIRCYEWFSLNNILISLKALIKEKKIVDEEIQSKINDIVLLMKLVDSYNGIEKDYSYTIKNKKLYIL
jgi:hypothetical protein